MTFVWAAGSFVAGCIVWEFLGEKIKVFLHLKESQAGAAIKQEAGNVVNDIKSKL